MAEVQHEDVRYRGLYSVETVREDAVGAILRKCLQDPGNPVWHWVGTLPGEWDSDYGGFVGDYQMAVALVVSAGMSSSSSWLVVPVPRICLLTESEGLIQDAVEFVDVASGVSRGGFKRHAWPGCWALVV